MLPVRLERVNGGGIDVLASDAKYEVSRTQIVSADRGDRRLLALESLGTADAAVMESLALAASKESAVRAPYSARMLAMSPMPRPVWKQ